MSDRIVKTIDPNNTQWQRRANAAERTVSVLKKKVRALQNGDDSGVVQRQIARMKAKQEQARQNRQLMEVRTQALQKYASTLEHEVEERTRSLKNILDHVAFGFLIVDRDMRIREGFTTSCDTLLGRTLSAGDALSDALGVPESAAWELELAFDQIFDDLLPEELTLYQMPSRFEVGGRILHVQGRTLRVDGQVDGVLLSINDATALEAAQEQNRRNAVVISILQQRSAFESFLEDVATLLCTAQAHLDNSSLVRRLIHTVKGNAGAFHLGDVVATCHRVEALEHIDDDAVTLIHDSMRTFLDSIRDVVCIDYMTDAAPIIPVDATALKALYDRLQELDVPADTLESARTIMLRPAREVMGPLRPLVQRLSEQLEKPVDFQVQGDDTLVLPARLRPVFRNLSHLLRNAIDHGIEPMDERGSKEAVATIGVRIEQDASATWIEVFDDGCGIDEARVVDRAVALGIVQPDAVASFDHEQRCQLIFEEGLSVAEVTTDISGRGVGMSAMKEAVESVGGHIEVHSVPTQGTRMRLRVPHAA